MHAGLVKRLFKIRAQQNRRREKDRVGWGEIPPGQVTEFRTQACGDALNSKSLQAKWSIRLPKIIPQYGPERTNKGPGGKGRERKALGWKID